MEAGLTPWGDYPYNQFSIAEYLNGFSNTKKIELLKSPVLGEEDYSGLNLFKKYESLKTLEKKRWQIKENN